MGADTVSAAIAAAVEDEDVVAIIFRIDSPGGSYVASDVIWREVNRVRDSEKPLIVSMGNLAASGGYFIAAPAYRIVALPGTVTGSIGVVGGKFVLAGLWDKLGVEWDGVQAGAHADTWSATQPFSEDGWAWLNASLDRTYGDFTRKVADGRGMSLDGVLDAAKGQVWTGEDAQKFGLIDELGGFYRAVQLAREAAGLPAHEAVGLKIFPERRDPLRALIEAVLRGPYYGAEIAVLAEQLARLGRVLAQITEAFDATTSDPQGRTLMAPSVVSER
jgi:protease-4